MYAKRIIPCLDVKNGRVVKGMSFVNLVDAGNPVEAAIQYDKEGADELVLLDITATSDGRDTMVDIVEKVANSIFIPFTVGGGIRTVDDFTTMLRAGADKVSVNSAAVYRPELINEASYKFGAQCVVVAIDAKRKGDSWEVYTAGGRTPTGIDAVEWAIEAEKRGAGELLVTSMDEDGQKQGYDLGLTRAISEKVNIPVIAIGGITHDNVMELAGSGICGIAVVSAIFAAEDITKATRELKELTLKMKDSTCISKDNASSRKGISC